MSVVGFTIWNFLLFKTNDSYFRLDLYILTQESSVNVGMEVSFKKCVGKLQFI